MPEGILHECPGRQPQGIGEGEGRSAPGSSWRGQVGFREGSRKSDRATDAGARCRLADGLPWSGRRRSGTRQALKIADAMAPCILFIDEIEKGAERQPVVRADRFRRQCPAPGDLCCPGSTTTRATCFVVATANDVSKLPPELTRAERFDGIFFLDLPEREEKDAIWRMYIEKFGLKIRPTTPAGPRLDPRRDQGDLPPGSIVR